ncbi:hypothetical protein [Streptomyces sp. SID12501]|uniref:hypothetical protein n=1 Tax=Streptomyces sp. SID12501 TaxID=2706042 RepID=UPI001EF38CEB|nr:hypothetical protein [Streptomyces sp. SID12501]
MVGFPRLYVEDERPRHRLLAATACQFTESLDFYPALRCRAVTLRVIVYDSHPPQTRPNLAAACDTRRRASLRVLAREGDWGFGASREPGGGTRMWATLPREAAAKYGLAPTGESAQRLTAWIS